MDAESRQILAPRAKTHHMLGIGGRTFYLWKKGCQHRTAELRSSCQLDVEEGKL